MKIRIPYLIFGMLGVMIVSTAVMLSIVSRNQPKAEPLPELGSVHPFALTTSESKPFDLDALSGKVWVANFIFTTCAGPCPIMSREMARIQRMFAAVPDLNLVSYTVDPATDTPEVLTTYAEYLGADLTKWHFLTGEYEAIQTVAYDSFHLGSEENPIHHSTYFALVDRAGIIRGYFDSVDRGAIEKLTVAIQLLLRETS